MRTQRETPPASWGGRMQEKSTLPTPCLRLLPPRAGRRHGLLFNAPKPAYFVMAARADKGGDASEAPVNFVSASPRSLQPWQPVAHLRMFPFTLFFTPLGKHFCLFVHTIFYSQNKCLLLLEMTRFGFRNNIANITLGGTELTDLQKVWVSPEKGTVFLMPTPWS